MSSSTTYWRWIGFVGAGLILVSLCWGIFSSSGPRTGVAEEKEVDTNIPKSHFSPADVVTLQVKALCDSVQSPDQMKICYSLASPKNREATGPYARFAQMVLMPPYDRLATSKEWRVEDVIIERDFADVVVSTVSDNGDTTNFRFVLHQYKREPYLGCWLTEAVMILDQGNATE